MQRSSISYLIRNSLSTPIIESDYLENAAKDAILPSVAVQAANIIRLIGDVTSRTGEKMKQLPLSLPAIVGSPNREFAIDLTKELLERGLVSAIDASNMQHNDLIDCGLTLDGWQEYESETRKPTNSNFGFLALQFSDPILDDFVENALRPAVKTGTGFDLFDMRNLSRAGVIDNIMRTQIRDAAFVVADLTHDNHGAYWEAGYAEGLGKPVIYICEKAKFETQRTHFDTNHCTTVTWSLDDQENFKREIVATLRRSLNLFQ